MSESFALNTSQYVIVAGYGPVGRVVCDLLKQEGAKITVVELNPNQSPSDHWHFVYGDIRREAVLIEAGIEKADALILCVPDEDQAVTACKVARQLNPSIFIAARTNFLSKGLLATQAGADHVVIEEVITAHAMKQAVLTGLLHKQA